MISDSNIVEENNFVRQRHDAGFFLPRCYWLSLSNLMPIAASLCNCLSVLRKNAGKGTEVANPAP